jgi:hypothetical protein
MMQRIAGLAALAATLSSAVATYQGFNYGSTFTTGAAKQQSDFEAEFKNAQGLIGAPGVFSSARLYTTVVSFKRYISGPRNEWLIFCNLIASWNCQLPYLCYPCGCLDQDNTATWSMGFCR